jgi:hypothetical protein
MLQRSWLNLGLTWLSQFPQRHSPLPLGTHRPRYDLEVHPGRRSKNNSAGPVYRKPRVGPLGKPWNPRHLSGPRGALR